MSATSASPPTASPIRPITLAGALPSPGVTFQCRNRGAGRDAEMPGTGAEYVLTVTAANGIGTDAEQTFTLTVKRSADYYFRLTPWVVKWRPIATSTSPPTASPAPTFELAGAARRSEPGCGHRCIVRPAGCRYPAASTTWCSRRPNSEGTDNPGPFTLDIGQAPVITSADNLTCEVGQACSFTLTATGFPDPDF